MNVYDKLTQRRSYVQINYIERVRALNDIFSLTNMTEDEYARELQRVEFDKQQALAGLYTIH